MSKRGQRPPQETLKGVSADPILLFQCVLCMLLGWPKATPITCKEHIETIRLDQHLPSISKKKRLVGKQQPNFSNVLFFDFSNVLEVVETTHSAYIFISWSPSCPGNFLKIIIIFYIWVAQGCLYLTRNDFSFTRNDFIFFQCLPDCFCLTPPILFFDVHRWNLSSLQRNKLPTPRGREREMTFHWFSHQSPMHSKD